jgi:hypothetical protein
MVVARGIAPAHNVLCCAVVGCARTPAADESQPGYPQATSVASHTPFSDLGQVFVRGNSCFLLTSRGVTC